MDAHAPLPSLRALLRNPIHLLAFGFGAGLAPRGPGTAGTLVAVPVYLVMAGLPVPIYLALTAIGFVVGLWICQATTRDLGIHDHPAIVWDEIIGYLVAMTAAPPGWPWPLMGFLLFRLFDIAKPWPISVLDRRLRGGLGIMSDDLAAGLAAWLVLQSLAASV
jgi:phosphatidylglycerophosphatase A